MINIKWEKEFLVAITVCDKEGIILSMNDASIKSFKKDGGEKLIGTNVLDCHPEPAKSKLKEMLEKGITNIYTTEKKGIKELIYQSPWYEEGVYKGFVEFVFEVPFEMPHFIRG
jgi:transcriptional regulator with PAS, ATPase and Fis domain